MLGTARGTIAMPQGLPFQPAPAAPDIVVPPPPVPPPRVTTPPVPEGSVVVAAVPAPARVTAPPTPGARRPQFGAWLTRPRRVLFLLAAVWVLSLFDLGFTLSERDRPSFEELNPLAAPLLSAPTHVIAAFKIALLAVGTVILVAVRRNALAEGACWFLLAAKLYVALRWYVYFDYLLRGYANQPAG
jgi:hypothetical protein